MLYSRVYFKGRKVPHKYSGPLPNIQLVTMGQRLFWLMIGSRSWINNEMLWCCAFNVEV